ncbi:hypothetical protein SAMN05518672_102692 [Chitinophaga sp. CF118]|nr:hypothetical protein SAMN05518672_102692 [Chitinophaga sp. CF118]
MKILSYIYWLGFAVVLYCFSVQSYTLWTEYHIILPIVRIELSHAVEGRCLFAQLSATPVGSHTMLDEVLYNTRVDCFFIICYVILLMRLTYGRMQKEPSLYLNMLLRINIVLAVIAGLLDYVENNLIFYNLAHALTDKSYLSPHWYALIKFILLVWILLVWLFSKSGVYPGKKRS